MVELVSLLACHGIWLGLAYVAVSKGRATRLARRIAVRVGIVALVVMFAVISVFGVKESLEEAGPSWRATLGAGTPGTFTVETASTVGRRPHKQWNGRFTSTDGSVVRNDLRLEHHDGRVRIGSVIRVRDTGSSRAVYGNGFPKQAVLSVLIPPLVGLGWAAAGWWTIGWLRQRFTTAR